MKFIAILLASVASLPMMPFNRVAPKGAQWTDEAAAGATGAAQNLLHSSNPSSHPFHLQGLVPNPLSVYEHPHVAVSLQHSGPATDLKALAPSAPPNSGPDSMQGIIHTPEHQPRSSSPFPILKPLTAPFRPASAFDRVHALPQLPESFSPSSSSSSITSGSNTRPILSDFLSPKYSQDLHLEVPISDSPPMITTNLPERALFAPIAKLPGRGSKRAPQPRLHDDIIIDGMLFSTPDTKFPAEKKQKFDITLPRFPTIDELKLKDSNFLDPEFERFISSVSPNAALNSPEDKHAKVVTETDAELEKHLKNMFVHDDSTFPSPNAEMMKIAPPSAGLSLD